jgi:hypothetical protein
MFFISLIYLFCRQSEQRGIGNWAVHFVMKWRGFGSKMSEANVQCCCGICLASLRKITQTLFDIRGLYGDKYPAYDLPGSDAVSFGT